MRALILSCLLLLTTSLARAAEPTLEVSAGGETRSFTRDDLLARDDATAIEVAKDATYGGKMSYRAVPVASLLAGLAFPPGSVIEVVAVDGFAAQIPLDLMLNKDANKTVAWLAIEPADKSGRRSARRLHRRTVLCGVDRRRSLKHQKRVLGLPGREAGEPGLPAARWPELTGDASLAADDPARLGQAVYVAQCLPCHKMNGAGASDVGPDLNRPMNPTEYMTEVGLHKLIRDPKSVRTWPGQRMTGFGRII